MSNGSEMDYYEVLQVSRNAEPDTIHRVYRLLAQRLHPDNRDTGDAERFRLLTDAYRVLSAPDTRAQYDAVRQKYQDERARLISDTVRALDEVEAEHLKRLAVLEVLYARRRVDPRNPGVFDGDLEELTGMPREHLEFTLWYLAQKDLVNRNDGSRLTITVEGVDHLERQAAGVRPTLRLSAPEPVAARA